MNENSNSGRKLIDQKEPSDVVEVAVVDIFADTNAGGKNSERLLLRGIQ